MRRSQRGFTLLEVLVAFALLAAVLGLLMGALSRASAQVRDGEAAGRARLHAQGLLDGLGVEQPLRPGRLDGEWEQGRYRWHLELAPARDAPPSPSTRLLQYRLEVRWGEAPRERLVVEGLRLAAGATP